MQPIIAVKISSNQLNNIKSTIYFEEIQKFRQIDGKFSVAITFSRDFLTPEKHLNHMT